MSRSTGTDHHRNPEYPTDTVYWSAPDGSWGVCQRGDLMIVNKNDISPRDLEDIISAPTENDRAKAMAKAQAKTFYVPG